MDSFMDKLAQKLTAQEMIKANSAADVKEMERLRGQLAEYDERIQEMRKLNLKNIETVDKISQLVEESLQKIEETQTANDNHEMVEQFEQLKRDITTLADKSDDFVHKENVKVYRNVQAVVIEENTKQTETLSAVQKKISSKSTAILVISIIAMIFSLANVSWVVLQYLGVI